MCLGKWLSRTEVCVSPLLACGAGPLRRVPEQGLCGQERAMQAMQAVRWGVASGLLF